MLLRTPSFGDITKRLKIKVTAAQWTRILHSVKKASQKENCPIHTDDEFIYVNTDAYVTAQDLKRFELIATHDTVVRKFKLESCDAYTSVTVHFSMSEYRGQMWDMGICLGEEVNMRIPLLREDGCYAGCAFAPPSNSKARSKKFN